MNLKQYLLDKIVQAVLPVLVDRATDAIEQGVRTGIAKALETTAQAKVAELTNQEAIPTQEVADAMGLKWPVINTKE